MRSAGVTGEITNDAEEPGDRRLPNEMQASKMDWYIQRKSTVKRTGDNTYHVTYSFTNPCSRARPDPRRNTSRRTPREAWRVNRVVIYTPAGGEVSNVSASNGSSFCTGAGQGPYDLHGRHLPWRLRTRVTIEYDVTTAAGSANLNWIRRRPSMTPRSRTSIDRY